MANIEKDKSPAAGYVRRAAGVCSWFTVFILHVRIPLHFPPLVILHMCVCVHEMCDWTYRWKKCFSEFLFVHKCGPHEGIHFCGSMLVLCMDTVVDKEGVLVSIVPTHVQLLTTILWKRFPSGLRLCC